ncbi:hypothetical protein IVB14_06860 [Bradyrhizobium sp. 180]|nr:hypothetical protein [Bradyrhizobium sp. CW12]MCK1490153.1 hypothetical protein [Bradyrhizobium sp. 180]MCK1529921.1 hypothetical protein [Bradyrhizobium sp. 182]MCK1615562.1 hypothetical protein [Bradyrhizobium sp. 159]MCK1648130.1 hypothetical protein [Bradyrhizobium sp. 154]MCK1668413.1 hypothetical protein [Bradyrhizobium sp. 153]MCK1753711.1 hypothetical protein [Bradyrhizobium sp. 137]
MGPAAALISRRNNSEDTTFCERRRHDALGRRFWAQAHAGGAHPLCSEEELENEHPVRPIESARDLSPEQAEYITDKLKVASPEVVEMNGWIRGDTSLNLPTRREDGAEEIEDRLIDPAPDPETLLSEAEDRNRVRSAVGDALALLDLRERHIVGARFLAEQPKTLEELAGTSGVSRERALQKIRSAMRSRLHGAARRPDRPDRGWRSG